MPNDPTSTTDRDEIIRTLALLEPDVSNAFFVWERPTDVLKLGISLSLAISLRRIADAMEGARANAT